MEDPHRRSSRRLAVAALSCALLAIAAMVVTGFAFVLMTAWDQTGPHSGEPPYTRIFAICAVCWLVLALTALVLGYRARSQVKTQLASEATRGRWASITAIVLGWILLVPAALNIVLLIIAVASGNIEFDSG